MELTTLHQSLLQYSQAKAEEIKTGNMDALAKLLIKERKQLQVISEQEMIREKHVAATFEALGVHEEVQTVSLLLTYIRDEAERAELEQASMELLDIITALRESEQLNTELLHQSMQFVQLSLEMLQPDMQHINYGDNKHTQQPVKRSVFDSKA